MVEDQWLGRLCVVASAWAGRAVTVAPHDIGSPPWTDGQSIFVDPAGTRRAILEAVAVQASMLAAGSLEMDVASALTRNRKAARRYVAIEAHRALLANVVVLPADLRALADPAVASRSGSPSESLAIAMGSAPLPEAPIQFGVIAPRKLLETLGRTADPRNHPAVGHAPRRPGRGDLDEFDDGEQLSGADVPDLFTSPVGGGGFLGRWLKKLLSSGRAGGSGGGPPGADSPTHRSDSADRRAHAVRSSASLSSETGTDVAARGTTYPEWDVNSRRYRLDWCTVREVEPRVAQSASAAIDGAIAFRRPLARLGTGLQRHRRQAQGDDIDIDAAVAARVDVRTASSPEESVYLDSLRHRRDLSVLLLLDVSGSSAEAGTLGRTVHEQQRAAAANLLVALHDLGDRAALYAYNSQGRSAVNLFPVKRMDEPLGSLTLRRLNSLQPVGYSRLGAAIRHGTAVLTEHGGTPRRLLVVLSDGLAYDHGYERAYGAADARRALTEARRQGTGCVCLTVGARVDTASLRAIFGSAAYATVSRPEQLADVIGPLFRAAVCSAEVRRRVS